MTLEPAVRETLEFSPNNGSLNLEVFGEIANYVFRLYLSVHRNNIMFKKKKTITLLLALSCNSYQSFAGPSNGIPDITDNQRINYGWGGNGGGNLEMYSKTAARKGELRFVYGGGSFGEIHFYHYNGSSWSLKTKIDKNGNWGIGTTNICPDCKLSVNGKIRATEVVIDSGWADYVLQPSYQLRPLEEVEAFIKENQHLPGVDSAATVKEKGLDLSKTSVMMMEKIEELTLYMIELKKQNDVLQQEVAQLKQK